MRILLDQNVDDRIKPFLESQGFKVYTTYEEGLSTESDSDILDYCLENSYVVLTHDDDFLSIADDRDQHSTVVFLPQRIRFREMKRRLEDLEEVSVRNKQVFP